MLVTRGPGRPTKTATKSWGVYIRSTPSDLGVCVVLLALVLPPGCSASETPSLPIIDGTIEIAPGGRLPSAGIDLVGSAVAKVGCSWLAVSAPQAGRGAVHLLHLDDPANPQHAAVLQHGSGGLHLVNSAAFGTALADLQSLWSTDVADSVYHLAVGAVESGLSTGCVYLLAIGMNGNVTHWTRIAAGSNNFTAALSSGAQFGAALATLPNTSDAGGAALVVAAPENRWISAAGVQVLGSIYILSMDATGNVTSFVTIEAAAVPLTGSNCPLAALQPMLLTLAT